MTLSTKTFIQHSLNAVRPCNETSKVKASDCGFPLFINGIIAFLLLASMNASAGRSVPGMPGPINGQTNVCAYVGTGQTSNYSIAPIRGATLYLWTVPPTVNIVRGQGTTSISVTFSADFTGVANKQIKVRSVSQDGNSEDRIFYLVAQQPTTPGPISGAPNACLYVGTTTAVTYTTARNVNATSYIWGAPAETIIKHPNGLGVNDTVVNIIFKKGYKTGGITVQAANSCGFSAARTIMVSGVAPSMPSPISGPTNACPYMLPDGATATYSIPPVAGASSYTWITPDGSVVEHLNGPGSNDVSIRVQYPNDFVNGSIPVIANSGCDQSLPRSLSINKLNPSAPGLITPLQTMTCPAREYSYTVPAMPLNTTSINWAVPADAIGFSGQGTTSITVLYTDLHVNGMVTATSMNNCASSSTRTLAVSLGRCQLERSSGTSSRGSVQARKDIQQVQELNAIAEKMEITIAPNPSTGNFKVKINTPDNNVINIKLLDLQGRDLKKMNITPGQSLIFGDELEPGTYILEVSQGKVKRTEKLMKL